MFVYELSGCGFESSCSHLNFMVLIQKIIYLKQRMGQNVINLSKFKSIGTYWIALYVNGDNSIYAKSPTFLYFHPNSKFSPALTCNLLKSPTITRILLDGYNCPDKSFCRKKKKILVINLTKFDQVSYI